ncbi:hypothetical protein SDRG_13426 [Saprolegnia diclina VS20]|uniref:Uncharacterized protein n=1 Tax=Saprolegnia diclina (strain VS20) TaxID=1156394 RepID=T0RGC2_SAPDV|nr:hypothetical protein SDRG_13426 [Saprolegnia diclina VS20]EQC28742.1 hypothetical protein SDRG_13426 [Saprolegnia diclina VS20]|eukprot:XP_008617737.1 hypothetical protein SDRG_13426 [Saprolegnia diclina VS20]
MDEELEQKMTFVLADIDAQLSKAHKEATLLLRSVRRHGATTRQMNAHCLLFQDLFAQLQDPMTAKAPTRAHEAASAHDTSVHNESMAASSDGADEQYDSFLMHDIDEQEVRLKTTVLEQEKKASHKIARATATTSSLSESNLSLDVPSPAMLRTPFMRKPPAATPTNAPSLTEIHMPTPELPTLSSNVQVLQAPTYSRSPTRPVRSNTSASASSLQVELTTTTPMRYTGASNGLDTSGLSSQNARSPEIPVLSRHVQLQHTPFNEEDDDGAEEAKTPSTPERHFTSSAIKATSGFNNVLLSPQWAPTPSANLRRRFSAVAELTSTPRKTPRKTPSKSNDEDALLSPHLGSPLLSTKLRVMTPHTPLSNRIAGADTSYQPAMDALYAASPSEPIPAFDLSLFPVAFQRGLAAYQMTTLYSLFREDAHQALTLTEVSEKMTDCELERLEIFLDTLVSRRLLRPFVVEGTMYWQVSTT